jgi:succinoglycan biosynthesis transport protein ExoP
VSMLADPRSGAMSLREFLAVLRRRFWSVALVTILVTAAAIAIVYQREPVYTSVARVEVRLAWSNGDSNSSNASLLAGMDSEALRVKTGSVVKIAAPDLGLNPGSATDVASVVDQIEVTVPSNTVFLDIACTQPTPEAAQACADTFAKAYVEDRRSTAQAAYAKAREGPQAQVSSQTRRINALSADLASATSPAERRSLQNRIDLITATRELAITQLALIPAPSPSPAAVALTAPYPTAPSNKDFVTTGVLALLLGLVLGLGMAFVRERFDDRIDGREALEDAVGAPVLAVVPHVSGWRRKKETRIVTISQPDSPPSEAYRSARTTALYTAERRDIKVIAVVGPGQGEGKTTTTANLAVSMSEAGKRVVAVSCDLRKPRLHRFFKLEGDIGLGGVLMGEHDLQDALQITGIGRLWVIASGPVRRNAGELLGSSEMGLVLEKLRASFDVILLDTAPALLVADAAAVVPRTDGVIVVADASKTARAAVAHMCHELERVGGRIIGGILNNLEPRAAKRYPKYFREYYSGSYRYDDDKKVRGDRRATPVANSPSEGPDKEMWNS